MDVRGWQWRHPWEKRTHLLCTTLLLLLSPFLLRYNHVNASDTGYRQESKNEFPDPNKLSSLSSYFPYETREDSEYKRASSFFPLRGKKPSTDDTLGSHPLFSSEKDELEDKRAQFFPLRGKKIPDELKRASYFMPMRGRKDGGWSEEDYDITDESPNKRASSFMPMRGKKKYAAISDYLTKAGTYPNDVSEVINPSGSDSNQSVDKRMHSFVPVRGKRSVKESELGSLLNDSSNEEVNHSTKKRSVSFMPMRGRRDFIEWNWIAPKEITASLLEKKKHSFMPMRGRRSDDYDDESQSLDKKASSFMPMRGRRDFTDEEDYNFQESKRASYFMPMRGRRAQLRDVVYESISVPDFKLIEEKRASSFMPMRGRRSLSPSAHSHENVHSDVNKKASSFMPMRGKRSIEEENDVELQNTTDINRRSVFMPVRGRGLEDEDFEVEPWPADQLYSLLDKRASSFMPMRGRRYVDEDFTVAPWPADQLMPLLDKKSSFMPMRGRRYFDEDITVAPWPADQLMPLLDKKSAFMPMRGRRTLTNDDEFGTDDVDPYTNDKRASSFMPMRGRRFDENESYFYNPYPYLMAGIGSSLMAKPYSDKGISYSSVRSPGARRKKLRINWDAVKRAFHATRGKRFQEIDDFVSDINDSYASDPPRSQDEVKNSLTNDSDKQTRTKRSIVQPRVALHSSRQYIALKRPMSFFATRGKRLDDSAIDKLSKLH